MSEYLVVRLAAESPTATWIALDAAGHRVSPAASGALTDIGAAAERRRVMLLVPGLSVISKRTTLPAKNPARLQQILPYALEDAVAEDVERLHFAAGPREASGETPVSIVSRDLLEEWLAACARAGLNPYCAYSEAEGVPETPGRLTLVVEGDRTYGRTADNELFAMEAMALGEVLNVLQGDDDGELRHVVLYMDDAGHARCEGELGALRARTASLDVQRLPEGPLPRFGSTLIHRPGSDLLQGAYGPKSNWGALLKPWRFAAGLLLGLALLTVLAEGVRYLALSREDQALSVLLQTECQQRLQSAQLASCRTEVARRLAPVEAAAPADGERRGFLAALFAFTAAGDPDSRVEAMSFRSGVMDLRVHAPSVAVLDALARNLTAAGEFEVSIQAANPTESGIEGRLQIVGAP